MDNPALRTPAEAGVGLRATGSPGVGDTQTKTTELQDSTVAAREKGSLSSFLSCTSQAAPLKEQIFVCWHRVHSPIPQKY